jgi:hypothetical protein
VKNIGGGPESEKRGDERHQRAQRGCVYPVSSTVPITSIARKIRATAYPEPEVAAST